MINLVGWLGTCLYLAGHAYLSVCKDWNQKIYFSCNLLASICLVMSSVAISSWQPVCINMLWAVMSALSLANRTVKRLPFSVGIFKLTFFAFFILIFLSLLFPIASTQQVLGWSSAYAFCMSYLLFCTKQIQLKTYLIFNAYAAVALLPQLWIDDNWPVFFLEICWSLISLHGVVTSSPKRTPTGTIDPTG